MGRPDKALYLICSTITEDEIGNQIETLSERMVYGEELYVGSNEFYNAAQAGLRPEKHFEVYTREYRGETKVKCGDVTYRIIRTNPGKSLEKTRLICERVGTDG